METIIDTLIGMSPGEQKELERFLKQKNIRKDRKDRQLLQILRKDLFTNQEDVIRQLYHIRESAPIPTEKKHAYSQWKYVLNENIEEFCFYQSSQEDSLYKIFRALLIARYLINHSKYSLAYKYLSDAEEYALQEKKYEMLQTIYSLQLEYAWTNHELNIQSLKEKLKQNAVLIQKNEALNIALNLIRQKISSSHYKGETLSVDDFITQTLEEYGIDEDVKNDAAMMNKVALIVQAGLEEKKDFSTMADYLGKTFRYMESAKQFEKHSEKIKIELLTSICRAYFKAEMLEKCESYLIELKKAHEKHPGFLQLNVRSAFIEYVLLLRLNRLEEALAHIRSVRNSHFASYMDEDDYVFFTLNVNLVSANLFKGDISEAKKHVRILLNEEKRVKNYGGLLGVVYLHLSECLIGIDAGDYEYVVFRLKAISNRFASFFKRPENNRLDLFRKIMQGMAQNSNAEDFENPKLSLKVHEFLQKETSEITSLEFLPFNLWLISKIEKISYFDSFKRKFPK